jgi:hypothetical protein
MYFDGELTPGEEREATDHLAICEECQALLGDAVALHAAVSRVKPAVSAGIAPRKRWQIAIGAATLVAAAAIAIVVLRPKPPDATPDRVALVLPLKRSLEVRFAGEAFAKYRPYEAPRDRAHEAIDVRALADLEARGETYNLVAALASSGELVRAAELARKRPSDIAAVSDLAAIALASGDAETALEHAYTALGMSSSGAVPLVRWNLALAARQLRLWRLSRAQFDAVAARGEPGWAVEAKQHVALIDRELARAGEIAKLKAQFDLLVKAGSVRATITDPALRDDPAELARRSRSVLEDETPIELALVRRYPSHALQFLHASLVAAATPDVIEGLEPVAETLDRVANSKVATAMLGSRTDPFLAITSFDEHCKNDIYALPCVPLAWLRARDQLEAGAVVDAELVAQAGRDLALGESLPVDYALLADIHRAQGRTALARAETEEATHGSR